MYFRSLMIILCIFFNLFFLVSDSHSKIIEKILVVINDDVITKIDFEERLAQTKEQMRQIYRYDEAKLNQEIERAKPEILQMMIDEILFTQEAMKSNIQVPDSKVQEELDRLKKQYGSDKEFEDELASAGYTIDSWKKEKRAFLLRQSLIRQKFESEVRVTDEDVRKFYKENIDKFPERSDSVKLKQILIKFNITEEDKEKAKMRAESILKQLREGASFGEMAEKFSDDPATKDVGGNLGYFFPGNGKYPEIEDAVSELEVGEISDLIETSNGYDIVKLLDVRKDNGAVSAQLIHIAVWPNPESEKVAEQKVAKILEELKNGAKFVDLVKKYSDDPQTKERDGDWMDIKINEMSPDLQSAFDNFNEGEVSRPVKTPYGIHIFNIVERHELSSEEMEQIRNLLIEKQLAEKLAEYSEKLRNKAYIQILSES
ncbi:MAG: peptidylprolyl isomerase [bacterium]